MNLPDGVSTFFDADGITIHVRRDAPRVTPAAGLPTLVSLHSLGTDMRIWDAMVALLAEHDHLRVDIRGHGLTDATRDITVAAMADDVLAVLDGAGITRTVMIGVSVGGQIALRAALARPDVVIGVVAMDTAARIGDEALWNARIADVERDGTPAIADAALARWLRPAYRARVPTAAAGFRNLLERTSPSGYASVCAALREEDLTPHLARLRMPVLALCGSDDDATPPALVRALAASVPDGRFEEIDGAGHLPCIDRPDAVAPLVDAFVRDLASR